MKRTFFLLALAFLAVSFTEAEVFRTRIFTPNLKTLIATVDGQKYQLPHIGLNSDDRLMVRFDEMSHETHAYSYRIIHCNADWTPSSLSTSEYLKGYTHTDITEAERSLNTTYLYTSYRFTLPNNDIQFSVSGNYVLQIFEDNRFESPLAQLCFAVYEPRVSIDASIRPNTDLEINGRYQQVDFTVNLSGYYVREPMSELKVCVRQNNRTDNEVTGISPTSVSGNQVHYINNRKLIFEAGSEFRSFDISSVYTAGRGIEEVTLTNQQFEVWLNTDKIRRGAYEFDFDLNGRFLVHHQEAFYDPHTEADYLPVYFRLDAPQPFFDGMLYIGGEFNYNNMERTALMSYNNTTKQYEYTALLKQGGYNYQYRFIPKGKKEASVSRTEGSYWQTGNEYTIYVYHRAWGERYDKLTGIKTVTNKELE